MADGFGTKTGVPKKETGLNNQVVRNPYKGTRRVSFSNKKKKRGEKSADVDPIRFGKSGFLYNEEIEIDYRWKRV